MLARVLFWCLLIYTWALYTFVDRAVEETLSQPWYIATVAPAVLFILVTIPYYLRPSYEKSTLALLVLLLLTAAISLARADFTTLLSVGSLCAMLIAMRHSGAALSPGLANLLFLLSIVACAVMHSMGIGEYGVIPGQTASETIPWRVSLFTYNVTPSWMFSLVVVGLNYFYNRNILSKTFFVMAALYFLLLSASRTGLIVLIAWIAFMGGTKIITFRERAFYKLLIPGAVLALVLALNAETVLLLATDSNNPILSAVLFKSEESAASIEEVSTNIERTMLWAAHAQLFMQNPVFGIGTFDFESLVPFAESHSLHGYESFLTGLFARIGLLAVLFISFIHLLAVDAIRNGDKLSYALVTFFALSSLTYGTYIVPYDFIFLAVFGAMNYSSRQSVGGSVRGSPVLEPLKPAERLTGAA